MKATDKAKLGLGVIGVGIIGYGLYSMKKDTEQFLKGPGNFLSGLFGPDGILGGSGLPGTETEPANSGSPTKTANSGNLTKRLYEYAAEKNPLSPKNLDNYYDKSAETAVEAASWTWDKYTGFLKSNPLYGTKLGVSLLPGGAAAVGITRFMSDEANKMFIKKPMVDTPQGTDVSKIKSHQQAVSMGLGMAPLAVNTQSDFKKSSDIYFPALESGPSTKYTEKVSSSSAKGYVDSTGRTYTPTNTIKAKW